jgi:pimeloyl-ACP methyl ester carboxylesterase
MRRRHVTTFLLLLPLLLNGTGCLLYRTGDLNAVRTTSDQPRAGNVYLVRGLFGMFSTGMDDVAAKLRASGVRAVVFQDAQAGRLAEKMAATYRAARDREPLVLVGHSLGADDVIMIARRLDRERVPVDLLITVDAVMPDKVPGNVRRTINLYKSKGVLDSVPAFRGIPVEPERPGTPVANCDIRFTQTHLDDGGTNHFNIDDSPKVQNEIVREILTVTPDRPALAAGRATRLQLSRAAESRPAEGQ